MKTPYIPNIPDRLKPARKFKADKRKALRNALKALDECRLGCAYSPSQYAITEADNKIRQAIQECSVENWGR